MTDQQMTTEELELFARAFANLGVTMTWDDKDVSLTAQVGDHMNTVAHAQNTDIWGWLHGALDSLGQLRDLEADGAK